MTEPRVVLITGASSGIGRAAAHAAASAGNHVLLMARGQGPLEETARECEERGAASATIEALDVGDDGLVRDAFRRAIDRFGRIDAVLHCASVVAYGRTEEIPTEVFDKVLQTNVIGAVNVSRHAVAQLRQQRRGSLTLVGSVIGHIAVPTMTPYALSKHAVRALARQLQLENKDIPEVSVSYVAPGGVDTPIYEQAGTYVGFHGKPPPPVAPPERIAKALIRKIDRPRGREQTTVANDVMRFGFNVMPWAFDILVGPLFNIAAIDRTRPVAPNPGNVLTSSPGGNKLHGVPGNTLVGIGQNVLERFGIGRKDSV